MAEQKLTDQEKRLRSLRGNRMADTKARQYQNFGLPNSAKRRVMKKCARRIYRESHKHQVWKQGWHCRLDAINQVVQYMCGFPVTAIPAKKSAAFGLRAELDMSMDRLVVYSDHIGSLVVESLWMGAMKILVGEVPAEYFDERAVSMHFGCTLRSSDTAKIVMRNEADHEVEVRSVLLGAAPKTWIIPRIPLSTWRQRRSRYRQWLAEELAT